MIRQVIAEDLPWLKELWRQSYAPGFLDEVKTEAWISSLILNPDHLLLRGEKAWVAAAVGTYPFASQKTAHILICATLTPAPWELVRMLRMVKQWAGVKGAVELHISALTGVDFGPVARRIGAVQISPSYKVVL